jgi:hypothetical protein
MKLIRLFALPGLLVALLVSAQSSFAQTGNSTASPPPASADSESSTGGPAQGGGLMDSVFGLPNPSSSMGQSSVTPSYELGGIGQARLGTPQAVITTAPTYGLPIRMDNGIFVYPNVFVGGGTNSNVVGTNVNPVSSNFWTLQPVVVGELKNQGDRYTLRYAGNYTRYDSSSADNYSHHDIQLAGDNYFTSRSRLGWGVGYIAKTDPRGSTDRGLSATPDSWNAPLVRALYIYGIAGAPGRIEAEALHQQKRYDNNRATTFGSDVDLTTVSGRFFYRVMPRTSAVLEVRQTNADYIDSTSTNDNTDRRYLVGLVWDATAKTTGTFKVGQVEKKFSSSARQGTTDSTWEGAVRWSPLTYSVWDLILSKAPADSTGFGDYIKNTGTTLMWNHQWASTISSRASVGSVQSDFAATTRSDNAKNYGLGFFYSVSRSVRAGLEWTGTDRSSNVSIYEFSRSVTMLSLEATL